MTAMIKILTVFGTRPEAIKMAPVIRALESWPGRIQHRTCVTAQHREILDQALEYFCVRPSHDLDLMTRGQSPADVAARVMDGFSAVLRKERPDWIVVQGDTTTTMATALAASYAGVKVAHIEAGLRTFDKTQPFPEEINRLLVSSVADLHFAPTALAKSNLVNEGVEDADVMVTGNPGVDALLHTLATLNGGPKNDPLKFLPEHSRVVLVTAHRRENLGKPLREICHAIRELAGRYVGETQFVYPVHPNSRVFDTAHAILGKVDGVTLLSPLDYRTLVHVLRRCHLVLTDSGGIQEEAPYLGKPILIMRQVTERPEGVYSGNARLIGTAYDSIVRETSRLLESRAAYERMARVVNLYGDGQASPRIAAALAGEGVEEWHPELYIAN
jgi:UDP-N-acetylglucosamine 2-epimerase (non-hydrolysing)